MKKIYFILGMTLGVSSLSHSAQWKIDGKLDQYAGWDDNVFMSVDNAQSSWIYLITPVLNVSRLSSNWDIHADASYGYQWYFDAADGALDQDRQQYNLDTEYRTERNTFGLNGGYEKMPNRYTAAEDTGFFDASSRTTWHVGPSWGIKLTEKDSLNLSADYEENTYSTDRFRPNKNITAKLSWARKWTERLLVSLDALYYYYDSDTTSLLPNTFKSNNYGGTVSAEYYMSEQWSFLGHVGVYASDSKNTIRDAVTRNVISVNKDTSVGPLADLKVKYVGEQLTASLDAGVRLRPSGNGGGLRQQVSTGGKMGYKLTERLSAGLTVRYYFTELANTNLNNNIDQNRQNVDVTPTLTYAVTQDWLVSASYRYRWQNRGGNIDQLGQIINGGNADSNLFYLQVGYNWPGFSFSR